MAFHLRELEDPCFHIKTENSSLSIVSCYSTPLSRTTIASFVLSTPRTTFSSPPTPSELQAGRQPPKMPKQVAMVVLTMTLASPLTESTLSPSYYEDSLSHANFPELQSHLLGDLAEALAEEFASPAAEQASPSSTEGEQHSSRKPRHGFVSPFKDCLDTFGKLSSLRFNRPTDGTVNSYIKFNWPKHDELYSRPSSKSAATQYGEDDDQNKHVRQLSQSSSTLIATKLLYNQASPESTSEQFYSEQLGRYSRSPSLPSSSASHSANLSPSSPSFYARSWDQRNLQILRQMTEYTVPKLPSHFGFVSQMDDMDRRFFYFCTLGFSLFHQLLLFPLLSIPSFCIYPPHHAS